MRSTELEFMLIDIYCKRITTTATTATKHYELYELASRQCNCIASYESNARSCCICLHLGLLPLLGHLRTSCPVKCRARCALLASPPGRILGADELKSSELPLERLEPLFVPDSVKVTQKSPRSPLAMALVMTIMMVTAVLCLVFGVCVCVCVCVEG